MTSTKDRKLKGYEFYNKTLGSPKNIVAPMVDHSEYAWRILSRKYNSHLCYTPMFHARLFAESQHYRDEQFTTGSNDRPLIVQFCANDPETLLKAAKVVENDCDAVDINLGCPQGIAKRGRYGSFLMEEWDLVCSMVKILDENLAIPVTCKIRIFPEVEKTIEYAKRLQAAGCQLLTVHGRTREMKGHKTGLADWEQIRRVKEALDIPVFANGNICYYEDVERCLQYTKCDGVMTAEGNLYNPALFSGELPPVWRIAEEYLEICKEYPKSADIGMIRAHLFKIFAPCLNDYHDLRADLASKHTIDELTTTAQEFKRRILVDTNNATKYTAPEEYELDERGLRILPNWICQPHFRPELPHEVANVNATATESEPKELDEVAAERLKRKEAKRQAKINKLEREDFVANKKARKASGKNPVCAASKCLSLGST
ncbi:UNVERIFIED_CONTAM: tRNA-dihydrouridine(16/17) synthase [NAD(P)(+)]-like protein, partial [Siphonaria sp. JEL0065]